MTKNVTTKEVEVLCPVHHKPMRLIKSPKYQYGNGNPRLFYKCEEKTCDIRHGAHPDGSPLGVPADGETRRLRQRIHRMCDQIWNWHDRAQVDKMYEYLESNAPKAHIGQMSAQECLDFQAVLLNDFPVELKDYVNLKTQNASKLESI